MASYCHLYLEDNDDDQAGDNTAVGQGDVTVPRLLLEQTYGVKTTTDARCPLRRFWSLVKRTECVASANAIYVAS